jgi:hypothetical protein
MAIAMLVDNPEGSQEGYDAVREKLGLEKLPAASSTSPDRARMVGGG